MQGGAANKTAVEGQSERGGQNQGEIRLTAQSYCSVRDQHAVEVDGALSVDLISVLRLSL